MRATCVQVICSVLAFAAAASGQVGLVGSTAGESVIPRLIEPPDILILAVSSAAQSPKAAALTGVCGAHLIRSDGTMSLGRYGDVFLAGLTLKEAERVIERQLAKYVANPEVRIEVEACTSKVCYVVTDIHGENEQLYRLALTGKETVRNLLARIPGLSPKLAKCRIWLARGSESSSNETQVLPVDWNGITLRADLTTNYAVQPGDRLHVDQRERMVGGTRHVRMLSPLERFCEKLGNAWGDLWK
jgi:protein involved in polysaccharide export with SLBB domain